MNFRGARERDKGVRKVADNNREWLLKVRSIAVEIAKRNGAVSSDDVRRYAMKNGIPEPHHPNAWGSLFRVSPEKGTRWIPVGYVPSKKTTNHARRIVVWRLAPV